VDAYCRRPPGPSQRPDEIRTVATADHGVDLCHQRGTARCPHGPAAILLVALQGLGAARELIKDGWKSVGKVFVLALVLDVVYQIIVMRFVYRGEAFITAVLLASNS
jgi:hypothetical protein